MSKFREDNRIGWIMLCPHCSEPVKYTLLTVWNAPSPFFYCDKCNNVLNRRSDAQRVPPGDNMSDAEYIAKAMTIWESIVNTAPVCPCGGGFALWSNVKCPHCGYEFPYNKGIRDPTIRVFERKIVIVNGATVLGDTPEDSWIAKVEVDE